MRAIDFVTRLLGEERLDAGRYKNLRLHMIGDDKALAEFNASSKMNTDPRFLHTLFERGRHAGQQWLAEHRADLGKRSTLDIAADFLSPRQSPSG
jgi:NTE family protein